eukprot:7390987-Prymnesium_polylepis.1
MAERPRRAQRGAAAARGARMRRRSHPCVGMPSSNARSQVGGAVVQGVGARRTSGPAARRATVTDSGQ